jgi:hypothetical protein
LIFSPDSLYLLCFSPNIALIHALNPDTNSNEQQIVLYVDMDSFFASVKVREKPELKVLPVVVDTNPNRGKGRGVVMRHESNRVTRIVA